MEENAGKKIEEEIEEMTKNLREKIQDAQTREIKRKNWKYWQPIRGINYLFRNAVLNKWLFRHRSLTRKEIGSVTPL
jgi:trans-aconitate methyltransferase